jgi:hypothetical protein
MNNRILFYSEKITPRLRYTLATIVGNLLSIHVKFTDNKKFFIESKFPKINYSKTRFTKAELFIESCHLLFDKKIISYLIHEEKDFFCNKKYLKNEKEINSELNNLTIDLAKNPAFNFDIFARIFYLISRYEEYKVDPSVLDVHERFSASLSVASRLGFLQQPVVNQYVIELSVKLKTHFPQLKMQLSRYDFQPTFDFDMAWLYKNKGFLRNAGGLIKDVLKGDFNLAKRRFKILNDALEDPYFTFNLIKKLHTNCRTKPTVFWLLGDLAKFDKNTHWKHPEFQKLIREIASEYTVGIHPSYQSNQNISILKKEVARLKKILNSDGLWVPKMAQNAVYTEGSSWAIQNRFFHADLPNFPSRQHFLKLRFPETYRRLLDVGIREDWTMGYADETGFRASIATPFQWFDLETNEETDLIIHPFQAMDVTLKQYLNLTPEAATERLRALIETTKSVGGTFTTLWHNDNLAELDDWKGWRLVYETLLADAL